MRDESVLGHDPADHLFRDAGLERGLDPAVPVPALGRGERLRHLRPESCVFVNGEPGVSYNLQMLSNERQRKLEVKKS